MKYNRCLLFTPVLALYLFFLFLLPAAAKESTEILVGYKEDPGYLYKAKDGSYQGYSVEYLYNVAQHAGLRVKFVDFASIADFFVALREGRIDMGVGFGKSLEREKEFLFSAGEMGRSSLNVLVRLDDDRFNYGDVEACQKMRFAVERENITVTMFKQWCAEYGLNPVLKLCRNFDEAFAAVSSGEADAVVSGGGSRPGYRVLLNLTPIPFFFIYGPKRRELKLKFDSAMNEVLAQEPLYAVQLDEKYFSSRNSIGGLSREEKEYVVSHRNVSVSMPTNNPPFSYFGPGGNVIGVIPDYLAKISQLTGLQFSFVLCGTMGEALEAVMSGRAEVMGMFDHEVVKLYSSGFVTTRSYIRLNLVQVTRAGARQPKTVTLMSGCADFVRRYMTEGLNAKLTISGNVEQCYRSLESGMVDAFVCKLPTAMWLLNQHRASDYTMTPVPVRSWEGCFVMLPGHETLHSILDKAIGVGSSAIESIISRNTLADGSLRGFLDRIPLLWVYTFAAVMSLMTILLVASIIMLVRRQREKAELSARRAENDRRENQLAVMEKGTEERNLFFSSISHDMRTPLNAIIGFAKIARDQSTMQEVRASLVKIEQAGTLLLELVEDTLTISRINSGKLRLQLEPMASRELMETITVSIRAAAEKKDINFSVDTTEIKQRLIMVDKLNFQKILLNLLSNAVKYTPNGGHVRFIACNEPKDSPSPDFVVIVSDDGIGISEDFLPHIYEPFAQELRPGVKASGTGLGLAIVKSLVGLMGGTINVKSQKGCGTTFTVRFHFDEARQVEASPAETAVSYDSLSGMRVLVCEDNEMNAEIAKMMLESKGVSVTLAGDGRQGVTAFEASTVGEYRAILMDLRMPVMGGLEATVAIRALPRADARTVKILAMTADAFPEDVKKCMDVGMNGHISKPIHPEKLFVALARGK